jgi:hypothetical protein
MSTSSEATRMGKERVIRSIGQVNKTPLSQALVAHTCIPSYTGGRDYGSKPGWANSPQDPMSKKLITK